MATNALAYSLDLVLVDVAALVVGVAVALVASVLHRLPGCLHTALLIALGCAYLVWMVAYFVFFWTTTGQSPGCRAMQIRVIDATRAAGIGVGRGIVRFVGIVLATIPLLAGFVIMLWDARRRCLQTDGPDPRRLPAAPHDRPRTDGDRTGARRCSRLMTRARPQR